MNTNHIITAVCYSSSSFQVLEITLFVINEKIGRDYVGAVDAGDTIFVHIFGAYFGLTVARFHHDDHHGYRLYPFLNPYHIIVTTITMATTMVTITTMATTMVIFAGSWPGQTLPRALLRGQLLPVTCSPWSGFIWMEMMMVSPHDDDDGYSADLHHILKKWEHVISWERKKERKGKAHIIIRLEFWLHRF